MTFVSSRKLFKIELAHRFHSPWHFEIEVSKRRVLEKREDRLLLPSWLVGLKRDEDGRRLPAAENDLRVTGPGPIDEFGEASFGILEVPLLRHI
jgi:hypothetical protein